MKMCSSPKKEITTTISITSGNSFAGLSSTMSTINHNICTNGGAITQVVTEKILIKPRRLLALSLNLNTNINSMPSEGDGKTFALLYKSAAGFVNWFVVSVKHQRHKRSTEYKVYSRKSPWNVILECPRRYLSVKILDRELIDLHNVWNWYSSNITENLYYY